MIDERGEVPHNLGYINLIEDLQMNLWIKLVGGAIIGITLDSLKVNYSDWQFWSIILTSCTFAVISECAK
jgi:hypothetical protein